MDEGALKWVIADAQRFSERPELQSILLFMLEAETHERLAEYRQAYVMAWLVAESWLRTEWEHALESRQLSSKRMKRLIDQNAWTAEVVSETLNLIGALSDSELQRLTTIRRIRNKVVHDGYNPSEAEARAALEFASDLGTKIVESSNTT